MDRYQNLFADYTKTLSILIGKSELAWKRLGLDPYETEYDLIDDRNMEHHLVYVAMPTHYRHWRYGKQAMGGGHGGHVFEVVINADPAICYLGSTNDMVMQLLVICHAVGGHVDFFKNNYMFGESFPKSVIERFAQSKRYVDSLIEDPDWGWSGVEAYLDAAHAIETYSGWLPTRERLTDAQLRDMLQKRLGELRANYRVANIPSDKEDLLAQIKDIDARLKCHPLMPTGDLLGFLMDPENTPHLPDEARSLIGIVRDQARYFMPQGRTKFMNEGWATYWEKEIMKQPELDMPFELLFDAAKYWTMHDMQPSSWYLDPYALGVEIWEYIDELHGFDEGTETIEYTHLEYDRENMTVTDTGEVRTKEIVKRNRDKMFEIRRTYEDSRFLDEFLLNDPKDGSPCFFERVNLKALKWVRTVIDLVNRQLMRNGWGGPAIFDPVPETLEGLMEVVQMWMNLAQNSGNWHQQVGIPVFPVHTYILQNMATILQIVAAYDEDPHGLARQLVMRTGYHSVPNIELVDSGRFTDGVCTLRHEFDPMFGELEPHDARDTLRFFWSLWRRPTRLYTKRRRKDYYGRPVGDFVPFEYFTEDGDTVKERYL